MAWLTEMRSERHGQRLLPSIIRWQKRANKAKARALMMRELWQYQAAEKWDTIAAEVDYDDFDYYDASFQNEQSYYEDDYADQWQDWQDEDDYIDYPYDPEMATANCRCPECRPDLYGKPQQHGNVIFYPLKEQP